MLASLHWSPNKIAWFLAQFGSSSPSTSGTMAPGAFLVLALLSLFDANDSPRTSLRGRKEVKSSEVPSMATNISNISGNFGRKFRPMECCEEYCTCKDQKTSMCKICDAADPDYLTCCTVEFTPVEFPFPKAEEFQTRIPYNREPVELPKPPYYIPTRSVTLTYIPWNRRRSLSHLSAASVAVTKAYCSMLLYRFLFLIRFCRRFTSVKGHFWSEILPESMWDLQSARRLWLVLDTGHFHRSVGCSQEGTRQCYDAHSCEYVQQPQVIDRKVSNLQKVRYCH